ncbi:unnamed protein product [Paramecium pentaurelia]|uniref:NACHT domain-containing protein n=1 Tax=Paramecium pentaurelia TaxID=43138 RepID=A0A8S1V4J9_9CILI|nr:unnamed protein product [Paramecium pentaurelia]
MNPLLSIDLAEMNFNDLKPQYHINKQISIETYQSNQQIEDQMIFILDIIPRLRGGGCAATKNTQEKITQLNNKLPINFASKIKDHTNIISEKSSTFSDKLYQDEILSSFQWFYNHKEYFQILCNDDQLNSIFYHLIETCAETLLKQLIIYIRLSGFLFYQLLDICNDLFRVIFSYQLKNEDRYMQESLKQSLLEMISEIESQISVESINLWKNGVEFELQLIKTCIAHCRTNSEKEKELVIAIVCGVASSISQLSPSPELIDALIEAGKYLLLNFYDKQIQHPLQKYEIYYFFENLKWSIINQLKVGYSVQKTINTVLDGFNLYIKPSKDWMIHFCWVKFISDLMSYRPIINKFSLNQQQNSNQLNWNELIVSNQIVQLPYDKTSGKLQIFGKKNNLNLKQFHQLILFQEYLLDIQEKFQLLPSYSIFQFNNQNIEMISDQDLNIKKLISESNLEIVTILNDNLKTSKDQLINLFETIIQQFTPTVSKIQSSLNTQISKDDIKYTIKQIKLYSQSFIYTLYELNIMINQERQAIEIIQNTLIQNKQFFKEKSLAYQISIIQIIKELEQQYEKEYIINFKKFSLFIIQIFHKLSIYQDEVNSPNLMLETSNIRIKECEFDQQQLQMALTDFISYIDKFIIQQKSIKRKFFKIYESKELNLFLQMKTSQKFQSYILINIYDFKFIQQFGGEFINYYNNCFIQQIEFSQIDLRKNRIVCKQIIMILKLLKQLLVIQQRKVVSLNIQKENVQQQDQIKDQQNIKAFLENIIHERRNILQKLYDKFGGKIQTDIHQVDFYEIIVSLDNGIDIIQKQNWSQVLKTKHILIFKEIKNKIQILELLKNNQQSFIMEIIYLFDKQLEEVGQEQQQQQEQIQIELLNITNNNIPQLKKQQNIYDCITSENLFTWDESISQIQQLIQNFKKISQIIQQRNENIELTQVSFQKLTLEFIKDTFNQNYFVIYSDLRIEFIKCLSKIAEQNQIVFNENFLRSLSEDLCLDQKTTIQMISEGSSFLYQKSNNGNQEFIIDKAYTFMLQNLKIENNVQGDGFLAESSYKVREATVFNLIKMQSFLHEPIIQEFCQTLLKQIWTIEKHSSVRSILKNKEMIEMQKKLFSRDLASFSNKLKIEMQNRLKSIEQLETQVLISDNQVKMKNQLQQAYEDFENYLDNITDMSQKMDISLIFLREISKDLKSIKSSIDQVLSSVKGIEDDVRRLSGKNYIELLQIRKQKILKQKQETELDQVHIQISTQEYDPVTGKKKENINGVFTSYLLKSKYNNFQGEINEFLWCESESQKDVLLLKGKAGSGKSRASRNIEEFLWLNDTVFPQWIPIYVSLPSLKDPKHNLLEQALESQNYNFDKIQIREFKEAVFNGNMKIILILESYDEMKFDCIQSNLYQTNRLAQDLNLQISGQNIKLIITTREEILTSIGYQTWFYGKSIETLKEVEILPFTQEQSSEYIRQYCEISVKRSIKKFYEFFKQLRGQTISIQEFKLIWNPLEEYINIIINLKQTQDFLFNPQDVDKIIIKLQALEFFNHIRTDQMISLKKELLKLWGQQKFITVIKNVNINHFMSTPFMMELIVYVLPKMSLIFSESNYLRETLKKQYLKLKREAYLQSQLINYYKTYQQSTENQEDISEIIKSLQEQIESQNFLEQFQSIENELDNQKFFENFSMDHSIEFLGSTKIISRQVFNVTKDANFIVGAFKLNSFTAYDFYETFVSFYHIQQLQNQKDLGKTFNYETTLNDLQDFSQYLALDMTMNQLTQVNYKQRGKLQIAECFKQEQNENLWEDFYFDENQSNSEYCNFLRKCIILSSKGSIYTFNHKSIQEFFVAKYILNLLESMFKVQNQQILCENLQNSRFSADLFNISQEHYQGSIQLLKSKLNVISNIKYKLLQIIQLSNKNEQKQLIRSASNAIYLLSSLQENLNNIDLSRVCLSDTKLNNLTFFNSNLNYTKFSNLSIESCNFNCATIENAKWENIICKEKQTLIGHKNVITSVFYSKDGKKLISGSEDGSVKIWQVQGDEETKTFQFPNGQKVLSASYSEELNILACLTKQYIQILNCNELVLEKLIPLYNYEYTNIKLSSDGQYIVAQNNRALNFIWKTKALQINSNPQFYQLKFSSSVNCIQASHNAKLLAIGSLEILILSIRGFQDYKEITKLPFKAYSLAYSNDDQVLAAGIDKYIINFWSLKNINKFEFLFSVTLKDIVNKLLYSYDNKYLICKAQDSIYLYETTKEQYPLESSQKIIYEGNSRCYDFELIKSSNYIAICTLNGTLIKQLNNKETILTLEPSQTCYSVLYNSLEDILIIGSDNKLSLYDISNIEKANKIKEIPLPFYNPLQTMLFNNQKQIIIKSGQYVSIHDLDDISGYKMFQMQNPTSNFVIINSEYFIIGIDNLVYIQSLFCDYVEIYFFIDYHHIWPCDFSFSSDSKTFTIIDNQYQTIFDIQKKEIIKKQQFNCEKISNLKINKQQTQAIFLSSTQISPQKQLLLLYDLKTNQLIQSLEEIVNYQQYCQQIAFSADSMNFVTGYRDNSIKLWDIKTYKLISMFQTNTHSINLLTLLNQNLLAQVNQEYIKLWNLKALQQQQIEMTGHKDDIQQFLISSDGLQLVSQSRSQIMRWDLKQQKSIDILLDGQEKISLVEYSDDAHYCAAVDQNGQIVVWSFNTKYLIERSFRLLCARCNNLKFDVQNNQLISKHIVTYNYQTNLIWDLETAFQYCKLQNQTKFQDLLDITLMSPDQKFYISKSPFKLVSLIQEKGQQVVENVSIKINSEIGAIAISKDSTKVALEDLKLSIILWSIQTKQQLAILKDEESSKFKILTMVFSGDSKTLFSFHEDGETRLWDVYDKYTLLQKYTSKYICVNSESNSLVTIHAFSHNNDDFLILWGEAIACYMDVGLEQSYLYHKTQSKIQLQTSTYDNDFLIYTPAYSENKQLLAIQGREALYVWDLIQKKPILIVEGNSFVSSTYSSILSFSANADTLYGIGKDQKLRCWNLQSNIKVILKSQVPVKAFQINEDTQIIKAIGKDNLVYTYLFEEFTEICLFGPENIEFLVVNKQESALFEHQLIDQRKSINLIDKKTKEIKYTINQFSTEINCVLSSNRGKQLIIGTYDGSIFIYNVSKQIVEKYGKPVCSKTFARSPILMADCCSIKQSILLTQDNENLEKLLLQKGAKNNNY